MIRAHSLILVLGLVVLAGSSMNATAQTQWSLRTQAPESPSRTDLSRTNETFYPFPDYTSQHEWLETRQHLRDDILFSMGCYPEPPRSGLNLARTVVQEGENVVVETVLFESLPGVYVTGNLHRPRAEGRFPAILSVHGHWAEGRFVNSENNSILGRAHHLAAHGYVVLTLDMVGYADFVQFPHHWGDPSQWLWGLNAHGLQYWNTVRALDALEEMPEVDSDHIGMTGASGGGTQTLFLMATDNRIRAAAPVNMISSHFQGGCICENAPNLRVHGFNTQVAAMMAPRPMLMVSATGDWTHETLIEEYPAVRSIYELYDATEHLHAVQVDAPHNYNASSREHVYRFFHSVFTPNSSPMEPESSYSLENPESLRVFPEGEADLPPDALDLPALLDQWKSISEEQLAILFPETELQLSTLQNRGRKALQLALQVRFPEKDDLAIERVTREKTGYGVREGLLLGRKTMGDTIPAWVFLPDQSGTVRDAVILLSDNGKQVWLDESSPDDAILQLLDEGRIVILADLFGQGEIPPDAYMAGRDNVSHYYCYNKSLTALQVQDILTLSSYVDSRFDTDAIHLVGEGRTGQVALLAAAVDTTIDSLSADTNDLSLETDEGILNSLFVPGLRRAGDFRTAQALIAPRPLTLWDTGNTFDTTWAETAYATSGAADQLMIDAEPLRMEELLNRLLETGN